MHPGTFGAFGLLPAAVAGPAYGTSEGWKQVGEMGLALILSASIGLEREIRQKSAGLRTHTLVGVGAALFMLVSKYGFGDVIGHGVTLDPSRMAAQIVSGVGFIGAGIIFVRSDAVRGLTTAAAIWVTAAIGACAGAGLPILAALTTGIYFLVAAVFPQLTQRLPQSSSAVSVLRVRYPDGRGILRQLLQIATSSGFVIDDVSTEAIGTWRPRSADTGAPAVEGSAADLPVGGGPGGGGPEVGLAEAGRASAGAPGGGGEGDGAARGAAGDRAAAMVEVTMHVHGKASVNDLAASLSELAGVEAVVASDTNASSD